MNNKQLILSPLYQLHAPYRPTDPYVSRIHIAEFNAIKSSSVLLSALKDRDFAPAGFNSAGDQIFAINPKAVAALEYTCEQLCLDLCEAGGAGELTIYSLYNNIALIPSVFSAAPDNAFTINPIRQELFDRLGLPCPELLNLALRTEFTPLYAHGTRDQLLRIFARIQGMARELTLWMIIARRRSALWGDALGWTWSDAGIVKFDDTMLSIPAAVGYGGHDSQDMDVEAQSTVDSAASAVHSYDMDIEAMPTGDAVAPTTHSESSTSIPTNSHDHLESKGTQLLIEFPERKLIEYPGYPFSIPLINHSHARPDTDPPTLSTTTFDDFESPRNNRGQLLIEYPEKKMIEYPGHPFTIPLIERNVATKPQLLLEYPERRLIAHPDYPFTIPRITSNDAYQEPGAYQIETRGASAGMVVDAEEGDDFDAPMEEVEFYFDKPSNVMPWLEGGNDEGYDSEMEVEETLLTQKKDMEDDEA